MSTSLSDSVHTSPTRHVSSDQRNSRQQSSAGGTAQWRGLRGAMKRGDRPVGARGGRRVTIRPPGGPSGGFGGNTPTRPRMAASLRIPWVSARTARFAWDSPAYCPERPPESIVPDPPGRFRATPESSCLAPMPPSALTKGYGGNPPSGRSVSPPRTGPFFLARVRGPDREPVTARRASLRRGPESRSRPAPSPPPHQGRTRARAAVGSTGPATYPAPTPRRAT